MKCIESIINISNLKRAFLFFWCKGSKFFPNLQEGMIRLLSFPEVTITDNEWLVKCRFNDN
ncbi:hypothetical protein DW657_08540 [Prevotella sp. AM23-5]|nr:hypothetical protein DW657_08540 [Prevotella sp. AM23-5]